MGWQTAGKYYKEIKMKSAAAYAAREARAGYECEEEKESYAQNNAVFTPFMTCPLTPLNDLSEMLLNRNDDMMKMGVNALCGVVLRM